MIYCVIVRHSELGPLPLIRNLNRWPSVPNRIKISDDLHDINNHTVSRKLFSQNHGMELLPQEKCLLASF